MSACYIYIIKAVVKENEINIMGSSEAGTFTDHGKEFEFIGIDL